MGLTEVAARLPRVVTAFARLVATARERRPRAAVLIDYTEFNLRLGKMLKSIGVPVLWCVAPQVWAWRPGRVVTIAKALDRLALILPFETALWRAAGVDAHYVGHPALDAPTLSRDAARAALGLSASRPSIVLLPGSRPHEVRQHTPIMLAALAELDRAGLGVEPRLLVATSLDEATQRWLRSQTEGAGVPTVDADHAASPLAAFDAAIAASGTATLECALAGVPPVVIYRLSRLSAAVARRFVRTRFVGLPNIVLASPVYPELLDRDAEPVGVARALGAVLERGSSFAPHAQELRRRLAWPSPPFTTEEDATNGPLGTTATERMASLLSPWLGRPTRAPSDRFTRPASRDTAPRASDPVHDVERL
jgi:lipid-A-disaccharide synthase